MYPEHGRQFEHRDNDQAAYNLSALVLSEEMEMLCPIHYVYNYLPFQPKWLKPQTHSLRRFWEEEKKEKRQDASSRRAESTNSITLNTQAANLPIHTGLDTTLRQSRHWKSNERSTEELIKLLTKDERCSGILCWNKQSMSSLVEEQMRCAVMDTYSRFSTYMFPEADENRSPLLAQCIVLIFVFDDLWENAFKEMVIRLHGLYGYSGVD
ncbi:MAG: hypothetical protein L6R42_004650 [Xanthoria sp. 1 TBL-2021]|nr:MAG: hypothetical protein L6R42_004650 [Xanthoria sp. 1 TBL-2021]